MSVMSSQDIIKSVSKKLKHYFEVRRLEDGFDLSGTDIPKLDHPPLKSRPTLLYDGLHDRPLKHYFHPQEVRTKLTHFKTPPGCEMREKRVRRMVEKHMRKCHYVAPAVADVMHRNELRRQGKEVPPPNTTGFGIPLRRRRGKSAGGASYPVLRNAPPRYLSSGEAHRLVNMATKLLVATEIIDLKLPMPKSKKYASKQSSDEDMSSKKDDPILTYDLNGRLIRLKTVDDDSAYATPRESSPSVHSEDKMKPWLQRQLKRTEVPEGGHPTDNTWVRPHSAHHPRTLPSGEKPGTTRPKSAMVAPDESNQSKSGSGLSWMELQEDSKSVRSTSTEVATQTGGELLIDYDPMDRILVEGDMASYEVHVFTGARLGASTRADVKLVLCGDKGRTHEIYLPDSTTHKVKFQKGQEDIFDLKCYFVGPLRKIIIGHDRKELGCGWFLESVVVKDLSLHIQHEVPCGRWLSARDSDGLTVREFPVSFSTTFRDTPEPHVSFPMEEDEKGEREEEASEPRETRTVESAPSEAVSHTSMLTRVSGKDASEEEDEEEEDSDDSSSSYTSSSSSSRESEEIPRKPAATTEVPHTKPPLRRKDTFFDQMVSEHDYSSAIEALGNDRDADFESNKPAFSERQKSVSRSASSESDTASDVAVLSRKDVGDDTDGSPRYKPGDVDERAAAKEKQDAGERIVIEPPEDATEKDRQLRRGPTIHQAAKQGDLATMKRWVEHNAQLINSKDERGWTVLHNAAANGRMDVVQWLSVKLPDLDTDTPTGYTAMHLAAMHSHTNCMMVLLAMGANMDCRSVEQQTPLHLACMGGHLNTVKWLVANGANLEASDLMWRTPLLIAEEYQHQEIVNFLCQWIAESDHSPTLRTATSLQCDFSQVNDVSPRKADRDNGNINDDSDDREALTDDEVSEKMSKKHDEELMEKKRLYEEQQTRMLSENTSFLDSIRAEYA